MRIRIAIAVAVLLAMVGWVATQNGSAAGSQATPGNSPKSNVPVIFVHGYIFSVCPGGAMNTGYPELSTALQEVGYTGPLVKVGYYACDTGGPLLWQYGSPTAYFPGGAYTLNNTTTSKGGNTDSTDIKHIAYQLAWFIYQTYSSRGQVVNVVGHSMGGLIMAWMLYQEQAQNPLFPPYLYVANAVSMSTPYRGITDSSGNASWCPSSAQCSELRYGSAFTAELQAKGLVSQASGGTDWTAIGGSVCDSVNETTASDPSGSTLDSGKTHKVWYYAAKAAEPTCYSHPSYLTDTSTALDMPVRLRDPGDGGWTATTGAHSLVAMGQALLSTNK